MTHARMQGKNIMLSTCFSTRMLAIYSLCRPYSRVRWGGIHTGTESEELWYFWEALRISAALGVCGATVKQVSAARRLYGICKWHFCDSFTTSDGQSGKGSRTEGKCERAKVMFVHFNSSRVINFALHNPLAMKLSNF